VKRILTATVGIALLAGLFAWGPVWAGWVVVGLVVGLAWDEFLRLGRLRGIGVYRWPVHGLMALVWVLSREPGSHGGLWWGVTLLTAWIVHAGSLVRPAAVVAESFVGTATWLAVGWGYFLWGGLSLWYLWQTGLQASADRPFWSSPLVGLLLMVWTCDTAAYYVGRWQGRYRLAPVVSPHKTVEGALAGLGGAILAAWLWGRWGATTARPVPWYEWVLVGLGVGVVGQIGDLVESAFKRWAGVKDTGRLLPGHGGMWDRIDSLILAAPFYYLYWQFGSLAGRWSPSP
jgi:phosphatidate cytidylyltransferase